MTNAPPAPAVGPTPLEERLVGLIRDNGPISIGDYMSDVLGHAQHGYYATQDPFGVAGDFTTAPEVSQVFGELIGAWLIESWETIGAPSQFNLVELGPGRGTLMADILRVGKLVPGFLKAANVLLVERSGRLRVTQQRTLAASPSQAKWILTAEEIPQAPTLIVANEFFDCLPIRQFVRTAATDEHPWRERLVGLNEQGGKAQLAYVLSDATYGDRPGMPPGAKPEAIFEECAAGCSLIREISARFGATKGRMLMIDYGHGRSGYGDTFQAVKRHDVWHPLAAPGLADITAHVDFAALARAGRTAGARVDGPVRQSDFLTRLGLPQRTERLAAAAKNEAQRDAILSGSQRLSSANAMGTLFKAMAVSSPGLPVPPGFA